jgi:hypothetical protein
MATKDSVPLFLSEHAENSEQPDIEKAWDIAVISSRILKASIFGVVAAAIVFAIHSMGNPVALFANATAFLVATSAPQDGAENSTPIIPSTAGVQALPPTASEAPAGDETAAPFETADQKQTEIRQPPAEVLLSQFQAWAANEDARAKVRPVQPAQAAQPQPVQDAQPQPVQAAQPQPVQDAQSEPVQDARPQIRPVQRHRQLRRVQDARAEIRAEKNLRAKFRRKHNARIQVRPVQDAQAQQQPIPQPPSLLQSMGLRD